MKRILLLLPFIALLASCYKDDINDLRNELNNLKAQMAEYQTLVDALNSRLYITDYKNTSGYYAVTLSDGTILNVGNSPANITVGTNGHWHINGEDTDIPASGNSPSVTVGSNGNWYIDLADTGIKASVHAATDAPNIIAVTVVDNLMTFTFSDGKIIQLKTLAPEVNITSPAGGFVFNKMKWFSIDPVVTYDDHADYTWVMGSDTLSIGKKLSHVFASPGTYIVRFIARNNIGEGRQDVVITIQDTSYVNKVAKVYDYVPAPGQFVNTLPVWKEGETQEVLNAKAEAALKSNSLVHLGGFGGYVVMGFDHTIVNNPNATDFRVNGNAYTNWAEPGVIMVSYDANQNGLPDDEWYEIAGSEYNKSTTIKNYEITYYKPDENKVATPNNDYVYITDSTYIRWTDNLGKSGYVSKNSFHKQSYYPQWKGESITFKGTFMKSNVVDQSGTGTYYVNPSYDYGYADNAANSSEKANIEIDWAVDQNGNPVKLKGIDFIKVYTGNRDEAGWLGEISTEVAGVVDLNL